MSTNYYVRVPLKGDLSGTGLLHIGKTAGGWPFKFRAYPEKVLLSWKHWQEFLTFHNLSWHRDFNIIETEYGADVPLAEFFLLVQKCQDEFDPEHPEVVKYTPAHTLNPEWWTKPTPLQIFKGPVLQHNEFPPSEWLDTEGFWMVNRDFS